MSSPSTPGPPSKRNNKAYSDREELWEKLSIKWDLQLQPSENSESPSKRRERLDKASSPLENRKAECLFKVVYLCHRNKAALLEVITAFEINAKVIHKGWIHKPRGDPDPISENGRGLPPMSVTPAQRLELLECFHRHIDPVFASEKHMQQSLRFIRSLAAVAPLADQSPAPFQLPAAAEAAVFAGRQVDDTPIPLILGMGGQSRGKRPSDVSGETNGGSRKLKIPRSIAGEDVARSFIRAENLGPASCYPAVPASNESFTVPGLSESYNERSTQQSSRYMDISADTSLLSNASSIFSRTPGTSFSSHMTIPSGLESTTQTKAELLLKHAEESQSTPRGSTPDFPDLDETMEASFSEALTESMDTSIEDKLREERSAPTQGSIRNRLDAIFPELPTYLGMAPLRVRYEITRVCLHANVPIIDRIPHLLFREVGYDSLWNFLKNHESLKGKSLPDKSPQDAWKASWETYKKKFHGVVLSAGLKFRESSAGPLFTLHLKPLRLDLSHRLGRRFGNDRFMELRIPNLSSTKLPKSYADAGVQSRQVVIRWLCHELPQFLGRDWKAFYIKGSQSKKKKYDILAAVDMDKQAKDYIYLFAIGGIDFRTDRMIPLKTEPSDRRTKMSLSAMLNWLIPLSKNSQQPFLKLFSRISLGLSRTWATVILQPDQIRYKPDMMSSDGKEVMNDGCGQLSSALALQIKQCLELTTIPSGFQGRMGGAKGFWIVSVDSRQDDEPWIEIYTSQQKWDRNPDMHNPADKEEDHRTFEVCTWSKPLSSAALNLQFLPLLEASAINSGSGPTMRDAIGKLLKNGLTKEVDEQKLAMNSSATFRQWVGRSRFGLVEDRLKYSIVPYRAALPVQQEERLNLFIDAGFDARKLVFFRNIAWKSYSRRCKHLQDKLKVSVGRSAYALIAIDFTGILEPNEVHLGFSSSFRDETSGWEDTTLVGEEILVARAPAHYISDIQKVKAVWKPELGVLKDVAVFSSKGNFPLAKKLSGGDYDGDIAWICWEPTMVQKFRNANVPKCPDLVKLGYVSKDLTTYSDLVDQSPGDPTTAFVERSFDFLSRERLLGICTAFKEQYCYTVNDVRNDEAVCLSTLLSDLVDQAKQGLTFTRENWDKLKRDIIQTKVHPLQYKSDKTNQKIDHRSHIIDWLKFVVARDSIDITKTDFYNSLCEAKAEDDDLTKYAKYAREQARTNPEWESLVLKLEQDIDEVKVEWSLRISTRRDDDDSNLEGSEWTQLLNSIYEKYQAIRPDPSNILATALLPPCFHEDFSDWSLLKASITFERAYLSTFVWWMAAKQLALLKARSNDEIARRDDGGEGIGSFHVVTPRMYAVLKTDPRVVKHVQTKEMEPELWDLVSQADYAEVGGFEDD